MHVVYTDLHVVYYTDLQVVFTDLLPCRLYLLTYSHAGCILYVLTCRLYLLTYSHAGCIY